METGSETIKTRDTRWDVLKGIAMILIIASHALIVDYSGYSVLGYASVVAIPAFFFVSGFLMSEKTLSLSFGGFLWKKIKTIWIPYTAFFILSFLFTQTVLASQTGMGIFGYAFSWIELLESYLFSGKVLFDIAVVQPPIWFLHALFITSIPCYFIFKIKNTSILVVIMAALMMFTLPLQSYLGAEYPYWIIKLLLPALAFMIMGKVFKRMQAIPTYGESQDPKKGEPRLTVAGFAAVVLFIGSAFAFLYGGGDIWQISTAWYFVAASLGIFACYLLSLSSDSFVLRYIGENSLFFLGLHPMLLVTPFVSQIPEKLASLGLDGFMVFLVTVSVDVLATGLLVALVKFLFSAATSLVGPKTVPHLETDLFEE